MNKKLENNWRSAVYGLHEIVTHGRVWCFSMNSTKMFTAEIVENQWLIKIWNRKSLHCEKVRTKNVEFSTYLLFYFSLLCTEIFTEEDQDCDIISMDCNDDLLVTAAIFDHGRPHEATTAILIRELKSGEVVFIVISRFSLKYFRFNFFFFGWNICLQLHSIVDHFNSTLTIADILSPSCGETVFKVRFGHGLLISHTIVSQLPQDHLAQVLFVHPFSFIPLCSLM